MKHCVIIWIMCMCIVEQADSKQHRQGNNLTVNSGRAQVQHSTVQYMRRIAYNLTYYCYCYCYCSCTLEPLGSER